MLITAIQPSDSVIYIHTHSIFHILFHYGLSHYILGPCCLSSLYILMYICGIYKNGTDELIYKAEIDTDIKNKCMDTKEGRGMGWDELGD